MACSKATEDLRWGPLAIMTQAKERNHIFYDNPTEKVLKSVCDNIHYCDNFHYCDDIHYCDNFHYFYTKGQSSKFKKLITTQKYISTRTNTKHEHRNILRTKEYFKNKKNISRTKRINEQKMHIIQRNSA